VPSLLVLALGAAWSNHFQNSFHLDDFHTIVNNRAIRSLNRVPQFFTTTRSFSDAPEFADYRPLLSTSFALDYAVAGKAIPTVFQMDTFVWFALLIFLLYFLFRLIPGGTHQSAAVGAALFGLHPLAADTVNYVIQRGSVLGGAGITAGLLTWIVWPRRMPERLVMDPARTPENWRDDVGRKQAAHINELYRRIIHAPLGLYFFPVVLAMLCDPGAAVFAPILLAWILLFEPERGVRKALPAIVVCGGYWIVQTVLTFRFAAPSRLPLAAYWFTQPWVAMRYLRAFLVPFGLSADTDLQPVDHFWSPSALAGYAGLALVLRLAIVTARRTRWRAVSFGLWWFLIALLPTMFVPQRTIEGGTRIFIPMIGLVLAATRTVWIGWEMLSERPGMRIPATVVAATLGIAVLAVCACQTWLRNRVWDSEETLWSDTMRKSPGDARAYINYGLTQTSTGDPAVILGYFEQAVPLTHHNAALETDLALAFDKLNKTTEAEAHFRDAIAVVPAYPRAFSAYGRWLLDHQRTAEASKMASRALQLEPRDLVSRQILMEQYSQAFDWAGLERAAGDALRIEPDDPVSQNYVEMSKTAQETIHNSEQAAKDNPTVDEYLSLSVLYFRNRRFEDCVNAASQALKIKPDLPEAYANMATAYYSMGKYDDAVAALQKVVRLRPDFAFARSDLAYLLNNKGVKPVDSQPAAPR
jgi:tetratricopeptide (TPR) repeat protein